MQEVMKLGKANHWEEHPYFNSNFNTEYFTDLDISKSKKSRQYQAAVIIKLPNQWEHTAHIIMENPKYINIDGKDWIYLPYAFYSREYREWKGDIVFMDPTLYMRIMIKHDIH